MVKINWLYAFGVFCLIGVLSTSVNGQNGEINFTKLKVVFEDGTPMLNPTAGGINSGQFSEIDLDLDGVMDLVVFDRTSNKLSTFIYADGTYIYDPSFEYLFPEQLINWVLLRDYDCDGRMDLFTSTSLGIKVYRNTSGITDSLTWELTADPVLTLGNSLINLFVNSTDLPSIVDVDGDDDLDILVFNFATGGFIEWHENVSMDQYGVCDSLEYVRVTREWGDFQECFCGTFAFGGEACDGSSRTLHVSGKALTVEDIDNNGLKDVLFGEEACGDFFVLPNQGTIEDALFRESLVPLPQLTGELFFPATYFVDIDHDGKKDLVLSPNDRGNDFDFHDFKNSVHTYKNESGLLTNLEEGFLQSGMIDVGERSSPTFGDLDDDGDLDLLIGNRGSITGTTASASLTYYENTGSTAAPIFTFRSSDYLSLSSLELSYLKPKLKDLNRDGFIDLFFTALYDEAHQIFMIQGQSSGLDIANLTSIVAPMNELDQYDLADVNRDGNTDLLVGTSGGRLDLFYNVGTNLMPDYELEEQGYLGLTVNPFRTNLSILVLEEDSHTALLTYDDSGEIRQFADINQAPAPEPLMIEETQSSTRLGRIGSLALGKLNADGSNTVVIGNIQGGIQAFSISGEANNQPPDSDWQVRAYPNPSAGRMVLTSTQSAIGRLISLSGKILLEDFEVIDGSGQELDLSHLPQGLYLLQLRSASNDVQQLKIIIDE